MSWKDHLDKLGIVGSFLAGACCLGLPAVLSVAAAAGLGFLVNDAVLRPLLIAFLAISVLGLGLGYRIHRRPLAVIVAALSAFAVYFFIYVRTITLFAYLGIAGLVAASILNIAFRRKRAPACEP
jgi:mercuric ion transport protein